MLANNETGTVLPIREIGAVCREAGVLFHSDMVQAMGKLDIDVGGELNVDFASFSGHKVYAPKGVGVLYIREGLEIDNLIHGGHQEGGRRAGTENMVGIAALGKACEIMARDMASENAKIESLRGRLLAGLMEKVGDIQLNGDEEKRLPNTLNLSFAFIEAESLLIGLDLEGIAVSTGCACSSGSTEPSHVLLGMGIEPDVCQSSLGFSLGREIPMQTSTTPLTSIPGVVARLREMSPFNEARDRGVDRGKRLFRLYAGCKANQWDSRVIERLKDAGLPRPRRAGRLLS